MTGLSGLCRCGCGQLTRVAPQDDARYGYVKGQPRPYMKGHQRRAFRREFEGYVLVWAPEHPRAINRYVFEHVLVAERVLGHHLPVRAVVHHVNQNTKDNANRNLAILQDQSEHRLLHGRLNVLRAGGNPWTQRLCCYCRQPKDLADFYRPKDRDYAAACKPCSRDRARERQRSKHQEAA